MEMVSNGYLKYIHELKYSAVSFGISMSVNTSYLKLENYLSKFEILINVYYAMDYSIQNTFKSEIQFY